MTLPHQLQDREAPWIPRLAEEVDAAVEALLSVPGVTVLGPTGDRGPVVAFAVDAVHPHDLAQVLDALRAGRIKHTR